MGFCYVLCHRCKLAVVPVFIRCIRNYSAIQAAQGKMCDTLSIALTTRHVHTNSLQNLLVISNRPHASRWSDFKITYY